MEDDAQLRPNFLAALIEADSLIGECGFIRLQSDRPQSDRRARARRKVVLSSGEFKLHLFAHYPFGALCYAIAPRVASAFVSCSRVLKEPVDSFIKKPWLHGAPLFGLTPYCAFGRPFPSTIGQREKNSPTFILRTSRSLQKLSNFTKKTKFNLAVDSQLSGRLRANLRKPIETRFTISRP
jgi:GR25 family glycosyltransferase involved in LPS biosynthesis